MSEEAREDASSPKKVADKGRKERREEKQALDDLRELLAHAAGRRFLRRLIFDECALNQTSYHASGQQFAMNEGRRGVAVQLQGELMLANLDGWLALVHEHHVKPSL